MTRWIQHPIITWRSSTSVVRLAAVLAAVMLGAIAIDATTKFARAWMPNIATTAGGIALTITVVASLIHREEERQWHGQRNAAYQQLDMALLSLHQAVLLDYAATRRHKDHVLSGDPQEMFVRWREDDADTRRLRPRDGNPLHVVASAFEFAEELRRVVGNNRGVLPNTLLEATSVLDARYAQAQSFPIPADQSDFAARWILEAAEHFAKAYREIRGSEWRLDLFGRESRLDAVPEDEATLRRP